MGQQAIQAPVHKRRRGEAHAPPLMSPVSRPALRPWLAEGAQNISIVPFLLRAA